MVETGCVVCSLCLLPSCKTRNVISTLCISVVHTYVTYDTQSGPVVSSLLLSVVACWQIHQHSLFSSLRYYMRLSFVNFHIVYFVLISCIRAKKETLFIPWGLEWIGWRSVYFPTLVVTGGSVSPWRGVRWYKHNITPSIFRSTFQTSAGYFVIEGKPLGKVNLMIFLECLSKTKNPL